MDLSTEQNPLGIRVMLVDDHLVMRLRKRMAELDREATEPVRQPGDPEPGRQPALAELVGLGLAPAVEAAHRQVSTPHRCGVSRTSLGTSSTIAVSALWR